MNNEWRTEGFDGECVWIDFDRLEVDYIAKLSHITQVRSIPPSNVTPKKFSDIKCDYTPNSISIIQEVYGAEIQKFGISPPNERSKTAPPCSSTRC